jgi:acyl-[acyl carrier protein]--UDP-N-acetylglucosamine O-acyltransferase
MFRSENEFVGPKNLGPKYELIPGDIEGCFRIRALRSFPRASGMVQAGDIGGHVSGEHNLSHAGNCWIMRNAQALDNSRVSENGLVAGESVIRDHVQVRDDAIVRTSGPVTGHVQIYGHGQLREYAKASGYAQIFDHAVAASSSQIGGHAKVGGDTLLRHTTIVKGNAEVYTGHYGQKKRGLHPEHVVLS